MTRIQIWDRAAIAKGSAENVKPGLWYAPDSKMREGETQAEWRLRMLLLTSRLWRRMPRPS